MTTDREVRWDLRYLSEPVTVDGASFPPGLVSLRAFPQLERHCDPRPIEYRPSDGAWRFAEWCR